MCGIAGIDAVDVAAYRPTSVLMLARVLDAGGIERGVSKFVRLLKARRHRNAGRIGTASDRR